MNNTDTVYVGWLSSEDLEEHHDNIKVFTHKSGAVKWKNRMNRRNQKTYLKNIERGDGTVFTAQSDYLDAGFDPLLIDRESK